MRNFGKSKGPFGSYPASGNPRLLLLSPASSFSPGVACVRQAVASFSPRCMGWCWAIGRWPVRELRWSHGLQAQFVVDDPDASTSAASFVRELGRKQIELVRNLAVAFPCNFDELHLLVFVKRGFRCSSSLRKLHGPILVSRKLASRSWGVASRTCFGKLAHGEDPNGA